MKFHLVNKQGEILISNFSDNHLEFVGKSEVGIIIKDGQKLRFGKAENEFGTTFLLADEPELLKSSRLFKEKLALYGEFLGEVDKIREDILEDTLHDLVTLQTKQNYELFSLINEEHLFKMHNYKTQIKLIEALIKSNSEKTAKSLYELIRLNSLSTNHLKQLELKRSLNKNLQNLQFKPCNIKKAVFKNIYTFFSDFDKKGVEIDIKESSKFLNLDYDTFSSAIFFFMDNISKYILPKSTLTVEFEQQKDGKFSLRFSMFSLQIKEHEKEKIFEQGYSGENAIALNKHGKGLGMTRMKTLLAVNNADVTLEIINNSETYHEGFSYENNIFTILFYDSDLRENSA